MRRQNPQSPSQRRSPPSLGGAASTTPGKNSGGALKFSHQSIKREIPASRRTRAPIATQSKNTSSIAADVKSTWFMNTSAPTWTANPIAKNQGRDFFQKYPRGKRIAHNKTIASNGPT